MGGKKGRNKYRGVGPFCDRPGVTRRALGIGQNRGRGDSYPCCDLIARHRTRPLFRAVLGRDLPLRRCASRSRSLQLEDPGPPPAPPPNDRRDSQTIRMVGSRMAHWSRSRKHPPRAKPQPGVGRPTTGLEQRIVWCATHASQKCPVTKDARPALISVNGAEVRRVKGARPPAVHFA